MRISYYYIRASLRTLLGLLCLLAPVSSVLTVEKAFVPDGSAMGPLNAYQSFALTIFIDFPFGHAGTINNVIAYCMTGGLVYIGAWRQQGDKYMLVAKGAVSCNDNARIYAQPSPVLEGVLATDVLGLHTVWDSESQGQLSLDSKGGSASPINGWATFSRVKNNLYMYDSSLPVGAVVEFTAQQKTFYPALIVDILVSSSSSSSGSGSSSGSSSGSGSGSVEGDPHHRTFDGAVIDFQGAETYTLTQYTGDDLANIEVSARYEEYTRNVSKIAALIIDFMSDHIVLLPKKKVRVNCRQVVLPFRRPAYSVRREGDWVVFRASADIVAAYNGRWKSRIELPPAYRGLVQGLLGNFDGLASNDLITRNVRTSTMMAAAICKSVKVGPHQPKQHVMEINRWHRRCAYSACSCSTSSV